MSDCEWNPAANRPATTEDQPHGPAAWSVGRGRQNWHLCEMCAALAAFAAFKRRVRIAPAPPADRDLLQRAAEALGEIANGSNGYRAGGGFTCDWCGSAGAECWADSHPKTCPRTIARSALSAIEARLKETA